MRKLSLAVLLVLLFLHFLIQGVNACTTFFLGCDGRPVMGTNLDWCYTDGLVIINKGGLSKTAIHNPKKDKNPAKWTSKYGSVTFSIYGREWVWGEHLVRLVPGCYAQTFCAAG